ncbi:MAG: hypothetical protein H0U95_17140 [Bacteroidetes bacterium]|nr:hypothetical protein [Bacteroidota bacterium]
MWKTFLLHGILAAILSSIASIIYGVIYSTALYVDFSKVLNSNSIIGASIFGCILIAIGQLLLFKWKGEKLFGVYNVVVAILSFASVLGVLGFRLPLDIESPELFIGLAIPMHFFPAFAYFTLAPFFKR